MGCADGPVSVAVADTTTCAEVRLEVASRRNVSNSSEYVLMLAWCRRLGTPYKGAVLRDHDFVLRRMAAVEASGGRCKLSFHVRAGLQLVISRICLGFHAS